MSEYNDMLLEYSYAADVWERRYDKGTANDDIVLRNLVRRDAKDCRRVIRHLRKKEFRKAYDRLLEMDKLPREAIIPSRLWNLLMMFI